MKKLIGLVMMSAVVLGASGALAGGACCAAGKTKELSSGQDGAKSCSAYSKCDNVFSKLNLSDEQKAKLADLKAECDKASNTTESWHSYGQGMQAILTPEQIDQCKTICDENGWKCPLNNKTDGQKTSLQKNEAGG